MIILAPILISVAIASFFISTLFLWIFARLVGAGNASYRRALLVVFLSTALALLSAPVTIAAEQFATHETSGYLSLGLLALGVIQLMVVFVLIQRILVMGFGRAFIVIVLHSTVTAASVVGIIIVLKILVMTAYVIPTNAMAPTIVGWHRHATCPHCNGALVVPAPDSLDRIGWVPEERSVLSICDVCRKMTDVNAPKSPLQSPDRILVCRWAEPERWDMIVFETPVVENTKWMKRLVGLPGETVFIKNGAVWINGAKIEPPIELKGLEYKTDEFQNYTNATPENPLTLGPNEYFVLGDFSLRSNDSRAWGALQGDRIEGVVCARYWPMHRLKAFR